MPTTINGIGTTYFGESNISTRDGVCRHCNRETEFRSYDTRLWFAVFFVPLIPLEKKRIVDYCQRCTRHIAIPLEAYNGALTLEKTKDEMDSRPNDPKAALNMYMAICEFGDPSELREFSEKIQKQFSDDVSIQFAMGTHNMKKGDREKALSHFECALMNDPRHPGARRAAAMISIQKGELPKASQLLSFMMQPGPFQDSSVLFSLAAAYQKEGQPLESMPILRVIARDFHKVAQRDTVFRGTVKKVEKELGNPSTILPKQEWLGLGKKTVFMVFLMLAVAFGGFSLNVYLRDYHDLAIINETALKATVFIDGKNSPIVVEANSKAEATISEGRHQIETAFANGFNETISVEIPIDFNNRFIRTPFFVLNLAKAAVLETSCIQKGRRQKPSLFFGKHFFTFRKIDYPFEPFPEKELRSKSLKIRLEVLKFKPADMMKLLGSNIKNTEEIIAYAEAHLRGGADNRNLVDKYLHICKKAGKIDKCLDFLRQ